MQVHRLQSPFKHWLSGLLAELAVFGAYMFVAGAVIVILVKIL